MYAQTNGPYLNRIQISCYPFIGPFSQNGPLGNFDPIRDLEVYVDGVRVTISQWAFDASNNRYLLYTQKQINLQGVIQVIHHMPSPPFHSFA